MKNDMHKRGLLNSSITLQKLSTFFEAEFQARCDFIANFIINQVGKIDLKTLDDPVTKMKSLFQRRAFEEKENTLKIYSETANTIEKTLLNSSFFSEFKTILLSTIDARIEKNNLYIELEYKSYIFANKERSPVLLLTPNFQGFGVDLRTLWKRIFET
ncbi:MAG: hypothetical protein KAQ72_12935 [Desulfobacula sp.]|nr:hypothetical protein [Desulfobacula sp.]